MEGHRSIASWLIIFVIIGVNSEPPEALPSNSDQLSIPGFYETFYSDRKLNGVIDVEPHKAIMTPGRKKRNLLTGSHVRVERRAGPPHPDNNKPKKSAVPVREADTERPRSQDTQRRMGPMAGREERPRDAEPRQRIGRRRLGQD